MKIEEPGVFYDFPVSAYFGDPCPTPSVTQSLCKVILDHSPLHAWHQHPRLNPNFSADDPTKYDVAHIAHSLMLNRGRDLLLLDAFDDWRTKDAQKRREEARAEGKLAVLGKHFKVAHAMVVRGREQLGAVQGRILFGLTGGMSEVVVAWQERGKWRRQMLDWLSNDLSIYADYKTTQASAAPIGVGRYMAEYGLDVQAAMAERGLDATIGINPKRRYMFALQETYEPYCLTVMELDEGALTIGRKKLDVALGIWDRCMERNQWPGYPTHIVVPDYPGWQESQWLDREETEFADNILAAG